MSTLETLAILRECHITARYMYDTPPYYYKVICITPIEAASQGGKSSSGAFDSSR